MPLVADPPPDAGDPAVDAAVAAATAYGRPDLVDRVTGAVARAARAEVLVAVVGGFKHGKTSLVDALIGAPLCPVDPVLATAVPTAVRHGPRPGARGLVATADARPEGGAWAGMGGETGGERDLVLADLAAVITEPATELALVEITTPSPLLSHGLRLLDVPGTGGPGGAAQLAAMQLDVDAAVVVQDAARAITAPELSRIEALHGAGLPLLMCCSRTDLHPGWQDTAARTRALLGGRGIAAPVIGLSTRVAGASSALGDPDLFAASGLREVLTWLLQQVAVVQTGRHDRVRAVARAVVAELVRTFEEERAALVEGSAADRVQTAADAVAGARRAATDAAHTLADRLQVCAADADHDLRARMRRLAREADDAVDAGDPATAWPDLRRWVVGATAAEVDAHLAQLRDGVAAAVSAALAAGGAPLAALVAEPFDVGAIVPAEAEEPADAAGPADPELRAQEVRTPGVGRQALSLLRTGYGGIAMLGAVASLASVPIAAPVIAAAGLSLGVHGLREERGRLLQQRRAAARTALRRHIDDVTFVAAKGSRNGARPLHAAARAHVAAVGAASLAAAEADLEGARRAAGASREQLAARLGDVDAELARLVALADRLAPGDTSPTPVAPPAADGRTP